MPPGNPAGYLPGARGVAGRSSVRKDPAAEQGKVEATMAARPRLNANRRRPQVQSVSGGGLQGGGAPNVAPDGGTIAPRYMEMAKRFGPEVAAARRSAFNAGQLPGQQGGMDQARIMPAQMPISLSGPPGQPAYSDMMKRLGPDPGSFSTPSGPPGGPDVFGADAQANLAANAAGMSPQDIAARMGGTPGMMKPGPGMPPGGGPGGPMNPILNQGLPPEIRARLQALQRPGAPGPGGGPPPGAGMMKPGGPAGPPAGGPPGMYGDVPPGLPAYFGGGGMPPGGGPFNPY